MKSPVNIIAIVFAAIVAVFLSIAPAAHAAAAAVSIGPVAAVTNASATASTGTNYVSAGNAQIDAVYITKSATNSATVWITTDQGVTVYSNTLVGVTSAVTRPRLLPTDLAGNIVNTNATPVPISFSGNLTINHFNGVGTNHTVTATITLQR